MRERLPAKNDRCSHRDFSVGLIRNYCKKERRTADLVSLLNRLQQTADKPARAAAAPRHWSLSVEIVEAITRFPYRVGVNGGTAAGRYAACTGGA